MQEKLENNYLTSHFNIYSATVLKAEKRKRICVISGIPVLLYANQALFVNICMNAVKYPWIDIFFITNHTLLLRELAYKVVKWCLISFKNPVLCVSMTTVIFFNILHWFIYLYYRCLGCWCHLLGSIWIFKFNLVHQKSLKLKKNIRYLEEL